MSLVAVVSLHDVSERVLAGGRANADWWESFVLIALLPALGSAHLIFLTRRPAAGIVPVLPGQ